MRLTRSGMKVVEVMTRGVEIIAPDGTLQEAARKMKALDVGFIPVCERDRLVGTLTDRDITVRAAAEGRNPTDASVRDVMTADVVFCSEDDSVEKAAALMEKNQIRRLCVVGADGRLVGVVSLGDLAVGTRDEQLAGEVVERVSEPAEPRR